MPRFEELPDEGRPLRFEELPLEGRPLRFDELPLEGRGPNVDLDPLPVEVLPLAGKLRRAEEPAGPDGRVDEPDCASKSPATNKTITTARENSGIWEKFFMTNSNNKINKIHGARHVVDA